MTNIKELKLRNLKRIAEQYNIDGPGLSEILGAKSKQHGYQLLNGTSPIGDETIYKICEHLGIDPLEFFRDDNIILPDTYPTLLNNTNLCENLEYILKKNNITAISAIEYIIKGVVITLMEGEEQVRLQRQMVTILDRISNQQREAREETSKGFQELKESFVSGDVAQEGGVVVTSPQIRPRRKQQ